VDENGIISTVAGTGEEGLSGDGGSAVSATLSGPTGIAVDGSGNLYIADSGNNSVRKIDPTGTISTVIADMNRPQDVAVDVKGNLYIADWDRHRIIRVDVAGNTTTVTGEDDPQFHVDFMAVDAAGNLYITGDGYVKKVDTDGKITTIAGAGREAGGGFSGDGGSALSATFFEVAGIALDASGNVYIADAGNNRVRKIDSSGIITTLAGNGGGGFSGEGFPSISAAMLNPTYLTVDGTGAVYVSEGNFDVKGGRVIRIQKETSEARGNSSKDQVQTHVESSTRRCVARCWTSPPCLSLDPPSDAKSSRYPFCMHIVLPCFHARRRHQTRQCSNARRGSDSGFGLKTVRGPR
jgi:trimeric autotransporter adhesin